MKTISIRIYPDGVVQAETSGIKGKSCKDYIPILNQMVNARYTEVELTHEYYESELIEHNEQINSFKISVE